VFHARILPTGFIPPCLPTKALVPPSGAGWVHEIKHDGFRVIARKAGDRVRLYSRPGNDLTPRFPLIFEALARLDASSIILDGEAVVCGDGGVPSFDRLRERCYHDEAFLFAFDVIELDGQDLRREPLIERKARLAHILAKASDGIRLNEHLDGVDRAAVFAHVCKLGLEGIVSKRVDSRYRSGRSSDWIKTKNPDSAAVRREAEEEWR
jgi:bifunctional non-homologous end joining protein LigD